MQDREEKFHGLDLRLQEEGGCSDCAGSRTPCPQCCFLQGYLWDNNQVVVEWLEKHMQEEDSTQSAIRENIKYLKRDYILKHIRR